MTDLERVKKGDERYYKTPGGDSYPSVTTILNAYEPKKKTIDNWEQKLRAQGLDPNVVRDRAALRGTLAHHRILNQYAIRELPLPEIDMADVDEELMIDVETCVAMWDDLGFEVESSPYVERRVVSHEHEYAGTLDLLTDETVVDLKTSKGAFDSAKMQASAYFYACRELHDLPNPDGAAIIVLHPDPEFNPGLGGKVVDLPRNRIDYWFDKFLRVMDKFSSQRKIV